jgi:hypothetical protein
MCMNDIPMNMFGHLFVDHKQYHNIYIPAHQRYADDVSNLFVDHANEMCRQDAEVSAVRRAIEKCTVPVTERAKLEALGLVFNTEDLEEKKSLCRVTLPNGWSLKRDQDDVMYYVMTLRNNENRVIVEFKVTASYVSDHVWETVFL